MPRMSRTALVMASLALSATLRPKRLSIQPRADAETSSRGVTLRMAQKLISAAIPITRLRLTSVMVLTVVSASQLCLTLSGTRAHTERASNKSGAIRPRRTRVMTLMSRPSRTSIVSMLGPQLRYPVIRLARDPISCGIRRDFYMDSDTGDAVEPRYSFSMICAVQREMPPNRHGFCTAFCVELSSHRGHDLVHKLSSVETPADRSAVQLAF
jgi:hypothetical protein